MKSFNTLRGVEQLALLLHLVSLFPSLDLEGLKHIISEVFGPGHWEIARVRHLLSILVSAKYVEHLLADNHYYSVWQSSPSLLEIDGVDLNKMRIELLDVYRRYFKHLVPTR